MTIKMRTGWETDKPIAHKLVKGIRSWGLEKDVSAVMIHGRSRLQRYSKLANWEYISTVKETSSSQGDTNINSSSSSNNSGRDVGSGGAKGEEQREFADIPIIGNGDIFSYTQYEENIAMGGGSISPTAMLARGALIKPWLPTEIKERRHWDISSSERLDMLKEFVHNGLEHWGSDAMGVNNTRRFLLEFLSFLYRYVPVGMLEVLPQKMTDKPPRYFQGRDELETLMLSADARDWVKISEMLLGPVPPDFDFVPKHKANSYSSQK
jgi:tRNA-dihydrouridine synthase 3